MHLGDEERAIWVIPEFLNTFDVDAYDEGLVEHLLAEIDAGTVVRHTCETERLRTFVKNITGWRTWRIVGTIRVPRLASHIAILPNASSERPLPVNPRSVWPTTRPYPAHCALQYGHIAPDERCECGIYSFRDIGTLDAAPVGDELVVYGRITYLGKVIPGIKGWRGQYARITFLIVPAEYEEWAQPLGNAYGVPVVMVEERELWRGN